MIAYADTDAGEIGTIYQACNWIYIGLSKRPTEAEMVSPRGVVRNSRSFTDFARAAGVQYGEMRHALLKAGWTFQPSNPKHRYVYVLDRSDTALVKRIERMRQLYPKRAASIVPDAPSDQGGEDGRQPIAALH